MAITPTLPPPRNTSNSNTSNSNSNSNSNNTATTSSPSSNLSRTELIKKNLFHRRIAREDSVRELSRLLAISRGNAAEDDVDEWESFPDEETGSSTPSSKDKRGNNRSTSTSSLPAPSAPLSPMSNVTEATDRSSVAMGCENDDDVDTGGGDRDKRNVEWPPGGLVRTFWWGRSQQTVAEAASAEPSSSSSSLPKTPPRSQRHRPECSICLEHFSPNDTIAWAKDGGDNTGNSGYYSNDNNANLACDHIFHEACLIAWLQHHDECPLCRRKVVHDDAEIRFAGWEGR